MKLLKLLLVAVILFIVTLPLQFVNAQTVRDLTGPYNGDIFSLLAEGKNLWNGGNYTEPYNHVSVITKHTDGQVTIRSTQLGLPSTVWKLFCFQGYVGALCDSAPYVFRYDSVADSFDPWPNINLDGTPKDCVLDSTNGMLCMVGLFSHDGPNIRQGALFFDGTQSYPAGTVTDVPCNNSMTFADGKVISTFSDGFQNTYLRYYNGTSWVDFPLSGDITSIVNVNFLCNFRGSFAIGFVGYNGQNVQASYVDTFNRATQSFVQIGLATPQVFSGYADGDTLHIGGWLSSVNGNTNCSGMAKWSDVNGWQAETQTSPHPSGNEAVITKFDNSIVAAGYGCSTDTTTTSGNYVIEIGNFQSTGVTDLSVESFSIFPNPTTDFIEVIGLKANTLIQITDITGRIVKTVHLNSQVDVSDLNQGIYFVRVGNEAKKLVKN